MKNHDFQPISRFIFETTQDGAVVTIPFSMTLNDPQPRFQGHAII